MARTLRGSKPESRSVAGRRRASRSDRRAGGDSYESSALNPIRSRRDRDADENFKDESEDFRLRAEWWRLYHGDASGVLSGELRVQAIAHAERLAVAGLDNPDPGGARPRSGFELIRRRDGARRTREVNAKLTRGRNPRPLSSWGFASEPVEARGPANLDGAVLKIALDAERLSNVDPATVRVFGFEATSGEWQLVPRSGARAEAGYAWAHL